MTEQKKYSFEEGVMWEDNPFEIEMDYSCSEHGGKPCKHCHSFETKIHERTDKTTYGEKIWVCPAVIIVHNEGRFNSTGLCLDCVLEGVKDKKIR